MAITNDYIARTLFIGTDWHLIRIGCRFAIDGTTGITGSPIFAIGVASGNTNVYGSGTTDHFFGVRTSDTSWSYAAGPPPVYSNVDWQPVRIIDDGVTITTDVHGNTNFPIAATNNIGAIIVDIDKGDGTNYGVNMCAPALAGAQTTITQTEFLNFMETKMSLMTIVKTGYGLGARRTLAIDEATDGSLDTVNFYWDSTGGIVELVEVWMRRSWRV